MTWICRRPPQILSHTSLPHFPTHLILNHLFLLLPQPSCINFSPELSFLVWSPGHITGVWSSNGKEFLQAPPGWINSLQSDMGQLPWSTILENKGRNVSFPWKLGTLVCLLLDILIMLLLVWNSWKRLALNLHLCSSGLGLLRRRYQ